ncbi:hypothetical protein [Brumimicrobium mesophilum]|uniref:hypothetical protein n=1 Tax=Brumimicrobium mesophilum TaxID=392717 RepID=UPI000D141391|nr:hypothetical protein [Brumimicrobium mesophilum]
MKKVILTSALLIFVVLQGYAQRFDYENTSKIFFGLNIGSAWHTTDVENAKERFPLGAGFVFGGSINQNYGNAVSFDLRFRYLGGAWYGKDSDTTSYISNNYALGEVYDTLGFAVQNFRAGQHRFALELSMHANRFKERTGIDPYIFAGIGITASNITGDLVNNSTDTYYPYNETPNGSIIDEKYETPLDMNSAGDSYTRNDFDFKVLPSLGVGIGYYFNSRFSMGIEHKTTFFRGDYFDGTTLNQEGVESDFFKNDLYHYTSIYFKWYLKGRKTTWEPPIDEEPISENPVVRKDLPIVDFTSPNSPHRTNSPTIKLSAKIQNVSRKNLITFTDNSVESNDFTFNSNSQEFRAVVKLNKGLNVFFLEGENQFGKDNDALEIYYEELVQGNPPIVKITNPTLRPFYINSLAYTVTADIQNVEYRNLVKVYFNDQVVSNFNFNTTGNNNFSIPLNLRSGKNTLRIEGRNDYGQDTDEAIIIYQRTAPDNKNYPPTVNVTTPYANPYKTSDDYETVVANVTKVNLKQQVEVRVNGSLTNNFSFNLLDNNPTYKIQLNTKLIPGVNTIRISAANNYGSDFEETQIIYRKDVVVVENPPVVNILTPNVSPYTSSLASENIIAKVENVDTKQQIEVRINGVQTNNFSYTNGTGRVEFDASLNSGNNTIRVTAINSFGNDFDETVIVYRRGSTGNVQPPAVEILTPSVNPLTTEQLFETVIAKVENVDSKSDIDVHVNGIQISNFIFNSGTNHVQFNASLISGANNVKVSASNPHGNDYDETTIFYRPAVVKLAPVVDILTPNVNPLNTENLNEVVTVKVENVDSQSEIEVRINGIQTSNFTFNSGTSRVQFTATLNEGPNTVKVSASNAHGSDFDETSLIYFPDGIIKEKPPVVNILKPSANPLSTFKISENITAKVENVDTKQKIEILINGVQTSNFTYNNGTGLVQFSAKLNTGSNVVKVIASNSKGNDSDETTIFFRPVVIKTPPVVNILTPNLKSFSTNKSSEKVIAKVENVESKSEIEVIINGIQTNNFTFNNGTSRVQFTATLKTGKNTVKVKATNADGTDYDESTINYVRKLTVKPPFVSFVSPKVGQKAVTDKKFTMLAKVERVTQKDDIKLYFNGILINPNDYSFNSQSQMVSYSSQLILGENTFVVSGKNEGGNHQASVKVERVMKTISKGDIGNDVVKCDKPTITMVSPNSNVTTIESESFNVKATIRNITNVNQIKVYLNGRLSGGFNYNASSKSFTHLIKIADGKNTYSIQVTNSCGTVDNEIVINKTPKPACGVKFEMINNNTEFCLITSTGTITSTDLISNPNFTYNGAATSIYFKATANGIATVGGVDYNVVSGNYYNFVGFITVDIGKNKPGMNGQWSVCVGSARPPLYGKGSSKPTNPCATTDIKKTVVKPNVRNKPQNQVKPDVRNKNTINNKGTEEVPNTIRNQTEPRGEKKINTRNVRNPG